MGWPIPIPAVRASTDDALQHRHTPTQRAPTPISSLRLSSPSKLHIEFDFRVGVGISTIFRAITAPSAQKDPSPRGGGGWGPDTVNVAACTLTLSDMRLMLNFGCDCHSLRLLPGWDGRRLFSGYVYLAVLVLTHAHRKRNSNPVGSMLFSFSFLAREPLHSSRIKPTLI